MEQQQIKYGILDVESTIFENGNPFSEKNKLCLVGVRITAPDGIKEDHIFKIEYDAEPYGEVLEQIRGLLNSCDTIVGFNLKFDLSWLARYGIRLRPDQRVFDLQLAYFMLNDQRTPFPSLNDALAHFGLPLKSDVVEREYWSLGLDTTQIPLDILIDYNRTDLERTDALFERMLRLESGRVGHPLFTLHMQDLRVLQEMEFNGLLFDWDAMGTEASKVEEELKGIDACIRSFVPTEFQEYFNSSSGDHLSALLYGGVVTTRRGTPYSHTYAGGQKEGKTETRYRWTNHVQQFERLCEPPEGSALKKDGFYSVDEDTLRELKTNKHTKPLVEALIKRADLEKLLGTYYHGIPKIREKFAWPRYIHGMYNQCRVVTGRLSSEKPNQQNRPEAVDRFVISRFN